MIKVTVFSIRIFFLYVFFSTITSADNQDADYKIWSHYFSELVLINDTKISLLPALLQLLPLPMRLCNTCHAFGFFLLDFDEIFRKC